MTKPFFGVPEQPRPPTPEMFTPADVDDDDDYDQKENPGEHRRDVRTSSEAT